MNIILNPSCSALVTYLVLKLSDLTNKEKKDLESLLKLDSIGYNLDHTNTLMLQDSDDEEALVSLIKDLPIRDKIHVGKESEYC